MFEKLKKLWLKFNKKENEEKVESKKKKKMSGVITFILFGLISTLVLNYLGVFDMLFMNNQGISTPSISSSPKPNNSKVIKEDFIIEDFIYENYLNKKNSGSYFYDGLFEVEEYFLDFIQEYNKYSLKSLEGKEFILNGNYYTYLQDNYEYIYNPAEETIKIKDSDLIYQNLNNIVTITLKGKETYKATLENTTLSFEYKEKDYIFEFSTNDFSITYNEGQLIEHYSIDDCSLVYYETAISGALYNIYVYEQIKNETNIIYNEEDEKYYLESSNEEVYDYNFELDLPNYYVRELQLYNINNEPVTIIAINILQAYELENGLPLGLSR